MPDLHAWLLASDPAIRWQVERDLLRAPESVWQTTRARIATEGWGAALFSHQDPDGQWASAAFWPKGFTRADWEAEGQPWTATSHVLTLLREFGLNPAAARHTVQAIATSSLWEQGDQPFWQGETEECINGRTLADGAWFGMDMSALAARLISERQPDGGWNCERCNGSLRSSYHSTINVLEGLWAWEQASGPTSELREARAAGEDFLLSRALYRRATTGQAADPDFLTLHHPHRWRYDILRALDYFRSTGAPPDPRLSDAIALLESKRLPDGSWLLEDSPRGRVWFQMEPPGEPSRWITLKALRVLDWWQAG